MISQRTQRTGIQSNHDDVVSRSHLCVRREKSASPFYFQKRALDEERAYEQREVIAKVIVLLLVVVMLVIGMLIAASGGRFVNTKKTPNAEHRTCPQCYSVAGAAPNTEFMETTP